MSSETDDAIFANLIDAHCHPTDHPSTLGSIATLRASRLILMGTRAEDWDAVERVAADYPHKVVPAFGIHPWFAASAADSTLAMGRLKALLARHPTALVGEIGIDGVARDRTTSKVYPLAPQLEIFKQQLMLAVQTNRRVSVHTVRAHGHLLAALQELPGNAAQESASDSENNSEGVFPPAVMCHSWSGSVEVLRALLGMKPGGNRLWFSFSTGVNGNSPKTPERIRAVPDNRVLIESDLHDADMIDAALYGACQMVADAKGWTLRETAERTKRNAEEFLGNVGEF
ncbi:hypothetical protein HDU86_005121 [Geranomyces michiganensis]|nr:hypothetical protein HDU86_005121 [Geranomyces michiganensis]